MAVEVLNVSIATNGECVLAEPQYLHGTVVKRFGPRHVGHGDVDVVDADDFGHGVLVGLVLQWIQATASFGDSVDELVDVREPPLKDLQQRRADLRG